MKKKEFLTIDEQIELLKSRGLIIKNRETAVTVLQSINYYRLSGYTLTLRHNDVFYSGVTLENVLELYSFDSCLRRLILDFTEEIEIEMRTHIAYHHAEIYGKLGYLDPRFYSNSDYAVEFLKVLDIEIQRSKEVFVKHYSDVYCGVFPIWVVIELISFGDLSRFYANLLPEAKDIIADKYYGVNKYYIENWFRCVSELRNICAHRGRIYNRPLPTGVNLFSEYNMLNKKVCFSYFIAILKLLKIDSRKKFLFAFKKIKEQHSFAVMSHLGAPDNWEEILNVLCKNK